MRKARSRKLAIMLLFTFMATIFAAVPIASASATYSVSSVTKVNTGKCQELGTVKVLFHMAELDKTSYLTLRLPADFDFNLRTVPGVDNDKPSGSLLGSMSLVSDGGDYFQLKTSDGKAGKGVRIRIPNIANAMAVSRSVYGGGTITEHAYDAITVSNLAQNEIKITVDSTKARVNTNEKEGYFFIHLDNVWVDSGFSGDVDAVIEGQSGTVFRDGRVIVASVGSGSVEISVDGVKTITTGNLNEIDNIRFKEDRPGAIDDGDRIKLKLPNGFKWEYDADESKHWSYVDKDAEIFTIEKTEDNDRTLVIRADGESSTVPTYAILKGLKVIVDDETVARLGDVRVTVRGNASTTPGEFIVAKYGEYGAQAYAVGDPKIVYAGRTGAVADEYTEIGKFAIEEDVKASLVKGRTITLQLVGGAKWVRESEDRDDDDSYKYVKDMKIDSAESKNYNQCFKSPGQWQIIGNARDTIKYTIDEESSDAMKAVFEGARISISADARGDIKLVVGGTAGASGEFVVAEVKKPVTASVDGTAPDLTIGQQTVEIPPIVVTENDAEAIDASQGYKDKWLVLEFPHGVLPTKPDTVEVVEGDIQLDEDSMSAKYNSSTNAWQVRVRVKATSTKPSSIRFAGIRVTTDRTVPEGDLQVKVKGSALVQNGESSIKWADESSHEPELTNDFPGADYITTVTAARCGTPAPTDKKSTAVFTIGEKTYILDGEEITMDVAPYIVGDRTFLPVRFVSNAVGVSDESILWNNAARTVTIFKGNRVVQMAIGSRNMNINGASVLMDVAPEIRYDRTMLPIRPLSTALGCEILWDDTTRTVTINH